MCVIKNEEVVATPEGERWLLPRRTHENMAMLSWCTGYCN
jgi:hypothetical protein